MKFEECKDLFLQDLENIKRAGYQPTDTFIEGLNVLIIEMFKGDKSPSREKVYREKVGQMEDAIKKSDYLELKKLCEQFEYMVTNDYP